VRRNSHRTFLLKLPLFLPVHVLQFAFLSAAHLILQSPHLARVLAHEVFTRV